MKNSNQYIICVIYVFVGLYILGTFLSFEPNPLNWKIFHDVYGRVYYILFIIPIKLVLAQLLKTYLYE